MSDIVSCFCLLSNTSSLGRVLCNSCKTALLKIMNNWEKSLHVSCDRVQNVYA